MFEIDTSTDFWSACGAPPPRRPDRRLTPFGADGTPQPSPVWFLWDGDTALIYSQPSTPKLRNIEQRPRVSLHFNCTPTGGDVVILTGDALVEPAAAPANANSAYVDKYAVGIQGIGIQGIGMTLDAFAQSFSVAIRVRPTSLRSH